MGDTIQPATVKATDPFTPSPDPLKFFKHWEKDGVPYDFSLPVTENFTLKGIWDTVYIVKFLDTDGTELHEEKSVVEGSATGLVMPPDPEKKGYIFKGWKSSKDGHLWDNSKDEVHENIVLIAKWEKDYGIIRWSSAERRWSEPVPWSATGGGIMGKPLIEQLTYMQDVVFCDYGALVDSMEMEKVYQLIDKRDGTAYNISKLKSGQVLMCQDLRIGSNDKETTLKAADSDFEGEDIVLPQGTTSGFNALDKHFLYIDETYGGYYPYYTATAGEGTRAFTGEAKQSILPKGWKLLTSSDLLVLLNAYGGDHTQEAATNLLAEPMRFTLAGNYINSAHSNAGYGYRWLSTANSKDTNRAYFLSFSPDIAYLRSSNGLKQNGFPIRGILCDTSKS